MLNNLKQKNLQKGKAMEEVKEILRQQLQLLAERSKETFNEELPSMSQAMLEIASFLINN